MRTILARFVPAGRHFGWILLLALGLTSCSFLPDQADETKTWSAQRLYSEAKSEAADGNYSRAIKLFESLQARFPYGPLAQQAQIEVAYVYYKERESISALAAADRFIKLYPNHPHVDYAYYLKGLVNFSEDQGLLSGLSKQDMTERDPKAARDAFDAFKELANRFPDSKYTPDAIARMNYLVNALASHEVHVARYYARRGAFVAAVNRVQFALETYPRAPALEEGLAIMIKSYEAMGLTTLRDDTMRVMAKNFPSSKFTQLSLEENKSIWKLW